MHTERKFASHPQGLIVALPAIDSPPQAGTSCRIFSLMPTTRPDRLTF
jgi:hypothetical protein